MMPPKGLQVAFLRDLNWKLTIFPLFFRRFTPIQSKLISMINVDARGKNLFTPRPTHVFMGIVSPEVVLHWIIFVCVVCVCCVVLCCVVLCCVVLCVLCYQVKVDLITSIHWKRRIFNIYG